jgi:hypothetical protein
VGAGPDLGQVGTGAAQPPDEVAGRIDLDLQPGLGHPTRREPVRLVLLRASSDPVGALAPTDRIELSQTLERAF